MTTTRVLVAASAVLTRRGLTDVLKGVPGLVVIGAAATPAIAQAKLATGAADVVVCDSDDAFRVEVINKWALESPDVAVVLLVDGPGLATLTGSTGLDRRVRHVTRPADGAWNRDFVEHRLVPAIRRPARISVPTPGAGRVPSEEPVRTARRLAAPRKVDLVVIGVSTGGPDALAALLPRLPAPAPTPIVIVQHMPVEFVGSLAERLTRVSGHAVHPAIDGEILDAGSVVVSMGGRHLTIARDAEHVITRYDDGPPEHSCRPAVDVLFRTAALARGDSVLGVVLTGMGSDGLEGSRAITLAGGAVLTQDEASSVVWGMPGIVTSAGLSDAALPLEELAQEIVTRWNVGRRIPLLGRRIQR